MSKISVLDRNAMLRMLENDAKRDPETQDYIRDRFREFQRGVYRAYAEGGWDSVPEIPDNKEPRSMVPTRKPEQKVDLYTWFQSQG